MAKHFLMALLFSLFYGCKTYDYLKINNIQSVHILYSQDRWDNYTGYKLEDGSIIKWDKNNHFIKDELIKNQNNIDKLKQVDPKSISKYISNKKTTNYFPIKVIPLKEFGYIKTTRNIIIFYGIMGEQTFIDLTNDKVYF